MPSEDNQICCEFNIEMASLSLEHQNELYFTTHHPSFQVLDIF